MKERYVKIDHQKLVNELKQQKKTMTQLCRELDRDDSYLSKLHQRGDLCPEAVEKLICLLLGKEPGYFIQAPQQEKPADTTVPKILENIYNSCRKMEETMQRLEESQETIFRKVNANTLQMERIKEKVAVMSQTEQEKAVQFLRNAMVEGRVEGAKVLMEADAAGIKRSELMKAKKELGIQVETTSYGKNQKSWWYLKY